MAMHVHLLTCRNPDERIKKTRKMKTVKKYPLYESQKYHDVCELLEDVANRYPNDNAFSYRKNPHDVKPARISYPMFCDDIRALSTEMLSRGMQGKHCALIGKLSYGWVCAYFALLATGAVVVPLDKDWTEEELASTVAKADCEFLFCDAKVAKNAEKIMAAIGTTAPILLGEGDSGEVLDDLTEAGRVKINSGNRSYYEHEIDPSALSMLVFTSGTTGSGKGVMLTQGGLMADLHAGLQLVSLSKKTIATLPPHHTYGANVGFVAHVAAGSEVFLSDGLRYIQKEMREERPEHLTLVPLFVETFYRKILTSAKEQGKDKLLSRMMKVSNSLRRVKIDVRRSLFQSVLATFGGKLRMIICGGAPLSQEIIDTFDALGITILNGYGITECSPLVSVNHTRQKLTNQGCVGTPLSCMQVKLCDQNADGEGEICVKGENVMLGYYKDDQATAAAFDKDDYFHTGDLGKFDADGQLYVTGRLKNLIILSNGKNVYPEEIENALTSVGGVLEIVVYEGQSKQGMEHNAIVAEIFPDADYLKKYGITDAQSYLQMAVDNYNKTAVPYKKIGILRVRTEEFPKNTLRKILRYKIDMTID